MSYIGNQPSQVAFVTDQFSGTGSATEFIMSVAPANTASALVVVSGVVQDPTTYSVSGTTLTFSAAPPSGTANISVRYLGIPASGVTTTAYRTKTEFTATSGQTTFTPPSYTAGFIDVFRNGVLLGTADYTATDGTTVVLTVGATTGDLITTVSMLVSSVLNAIPNTTGAVGSGNIANAAITPAKLSTGAPTWDSSGRFFTPSQPAFYGFRNGGNVTGSTTVVHNAVITNIGSHYNASTGVFTCPVAGVYEVMVGGHAENSQPIAMQIKQNGTVKSEEYANGAAYSAVSAFAILSCAANDTITHVVSVGTFWGGNDSGLRMSVKLIG